jgi:hypothetical protein
MAEYQFWEIFDEKLTFKGKSRFEQISPGNPIEGTPARTNPCTTPDPPITHTCYHLYLDQLIS